MFEKLARFRRFEPRHFMPRRLEAAHSNDNQPGRRRPEDRHRCAQPLLACHWSIVDETRLECRWEIVSIDDSERRADGQGIR
ncbi:hypothetical protein [Afipia sp. GAS231]|uniref:hypothetical protein n=1 Tax=Afipia sp. GAS231 TaxID=1882747 RepID=UPI00087D74A4|nr:hypothetical protein [Afipia sp. GAS231]SDP00458.1 hypothetical protein SAMN05444050_5568 [Afipia sp. GAS231]